MMYFANLDRAIRNASNGRRTPLTALRPLFERRLKGQPTTIARWEAWLRAEQGEGEVTVFRRSLLDGAMIWPVSRAFGPHLVMVANAAPNENDSGFISEWHATAGDARLVPLRD